MFGGGDDIEDDETCTVAKLQIGVFGDIRKWQKDLDRIAEAHDTEDDEGLHAIFRDALTLMLRNIEYCSYATSGGKIFNDFDSCERKFNAVSMEERAKFKEETLVNVDGRRKVATFANKGVGDGLDNWLCVTLLIATEGALKLQKINSPYDLKQVIMALGAVRPEDLMAFELLWTPQEEGDYYTKNELLTDFPNMATLS